MNGVFDLILDKDEQIIETFKPHKGKLFFKSVLLSTIWIIFVLLYPIALFSLMENILLVLILVGVYVVAEAICLLLTKMCYDKTFYAYTNKRVIIRTGIIGTDFKSLDMKMIGAVDVYVSLLDKILRKNTGTLKFGSMSSPINGQVNAYSFAHVIAPYDNYKKIKEYIEDCKNNKDEK